MRAMKFPLALTALISVGALLLALTGCGGGGSSSTGSTTVGAGTTVSSIVVSPATASIAVGSTQKFTAVAKNASGGTVSGVTFAWTSSDTGVATIDASGLATGVAAGTTDIAASAQGVTSAAATLTVTASSASTPLMGQYAFLVSGYDSAVAGSVTLDGNGNVTGGVEDIRAPGTNLSGSDLAISSGSYLVGPDNRGMLSYTDSQGHSFTFAIAVGGISNGVATQGQMVEFDGNPLEMTGSMALQTSADFSVSALSGSYAFGSSGWNNGVQPDVTVGSFTVSGGTISNGLFDQNDGGTVTSAAAVTGSIGTIDSNGRGTLTVTTGAGSNTFDMYVVSAGKCFVISDVSDPEVQSGPVLQQSGSPFSSSSLNGAAILTVQSEDGVPAPVATLGQVTFTAGSFSGVVDQNDNGTVALSQSASGTWSLTAASHGRFLLTPSGAHPLVGYLIGPNRAFLTDSASVIPSFATLEPQSAGPFTNGSLSGTYFVGTLPMLSAGAPGNPTPALNMQTGVETFSGSGSASGTFDINFSGGTTTDYPYSDTYAVATSGRTTLTSGSAVIWIVSASKAYALMIGQGQPSSPNPTILVLQK